MDGVVTDTASLHARAWKRLFDEILAARSDYRSVDATPFDADVDYRRYVDGRSREDGVVTFLSARGVQLPPGGPDDPSGANTVWAVAARKNRMFLEGVLRWRPNLPLDGQSPPAPACQASSSPSAR